MKALARIVLQRYVRRGPPFAVVVGVGVVGDELVAVAVHVEVALAHLRIVLVEVILLRGSRGPCRGAAGLIYFLGDALCIVGP